MWAAPPGFLPAGPRFSQRRHQQEIRDERVKAGVYPTIPSTRMLWAGYRCPKSIAPVRGHSLPIFQT